MDNDNSFSLITFVCSLLALVLALCSFLPISYNELNDLPDLFELDDIPSVDLAHGLCLWLPFDGSVNDKSGYSCNSSVLGSVNYDTAVFERGIYSNVSGYVSVSDTAVLDTGVVAVASWFKLSSFVSNFNWLFDKVDLVEPRKGWLCYVTNQLVSPYTDYYLLWRCYNNGIASAKQVVGNVPIELGVWYFFYGVFSGDDVYFVLYDFSGLVDSKNLGSGQSVGFSAGCAVRVVSNGGGYTNCTIDDFRLYNRVLSEYEVFALYNLNI